MEPTDRLKEIRNDLSLNRKQVADIVNFNPSYYSQIERGEKEITAKLLRNLFVHFQVSSNYILTGTLPKFIGSKTEIFEHKNEHSDEHLAQKEAVSKNNYLSENQEVTLNRFQHRLDKIRVELKEEYPELHEVYDLIVQLNNEAEKINHSTLDIQDTFVLIISEIEIKKPNYDPAEVFKEAIDFLEYYKQKEGSIRDWIDKLKSVRSALDKLSSNS